MERRKTCALSSLKIFNAIMRSESTLLYIGFLIYLLINHTFPHCSSNFLFLTALKMSSTSSKNSLFSIEPYTLSNNSLFSIEEYNHGANQMSQQDESKSDADKSHAFFISSMNSTPVISTEVKMFRLVKGLIRLQMGFALISRSIFAEYHAK